MKSKDEFKITEYGKMIENLNHISTHLQNFYWYFLGSIATIGVAYKTIIGKELDLCQHQKTWLILGVCLIGNIVFWLIGEYAIAHGFLFRFCQAKAARAEKEVWGNNHLVKDPYDIKHYIIYIKNGKRRFYPVYILPDQFVPIYWASIWLISVNAIISFYLLYSVVVINEWLCIAFACALISLPLIWKLWDYYIHKIKEFLKDSKIKDYYFSIRKNQTDNFFIFPRWIIILLLPVFAGLLFHLVKIIFRLKKCRNKHLSLKYDEKIEEFSCWLRRFLFYLELVT